MDVADWLRALGLEQYEATFRENDVDPELLPDLTEDDLKGLGVASIGHRRRLLKAIAALRDNAASLQAEDHQASKPAAPPVIASGQPYEDPAPHGGERRQLTVMFCDLVGSTALSEKLDPEELRTLLHVYRTLCGDVIARYDGFVARYVGDGILTYFGWPTAHEEDAERALRAALEIVHTVKRASSTEDLSVRIGIATGPVVVGEQAGTGDQSKLAVGSTPNLAARLQGLAVADQIVIAASTRRLVGNAFELTDLGEHDLKGIAEPVHGWRVERLLATESRFDASRGDSVLTPLVGRDEELDLLLRRCSQTKDGEGQVALLSGEPGIGKSRILSALRERLEAQGVQALRFQCSPYYVNSAFWPVIDNFERALKFARDDTADAKLDKLEALIVTQYGRSLADVRFVASILSIPCEARYGVLPMTPQKFKDETLRTLVDLVEAAARHRPSVMLFEDAHWADPTTLEVLDLLIDRVRSVPLLLVLTHRPEFQSRWSGHGHVAALNLSKLTRAQSAAMVSSLAGGKTLPGVLLEQILTRTDGVPLFVEELTKSILESGELRGLSDRYEYTSSARAVTIPATLRDSLMARLDRFTPVREIAQIGAAIGREFSYELVAAVAPMPQAQRDDALARLCESGLAFRRGTPPDALYTFKHALVQDAAYDSVLKSRRQELHAKIARVIDARFPDIKTTEPEVLAHHLTAAGLTEAAIPLWQAAGELTLKRMALTEAISHLNRGLELVAELPGGGDRDDRELHLLLVLGPALMTTRSSAAPEIGSVYARARQLAQEGGFLGELFPTLWGSWLVAFTSNDLTTANRLLDELFEIARNQASSELLLQAHHAAWPTLIALGELTKAQQHIESGLALYEPDTQHAHSQRYGGHDPGVCGHVLCAMVRAALGFPDEAVRQMDQGRVLAESLEHPPSLSQALWFSADLCYLRREPHAVRDFVAAALPMLSEHGSAVGMANAMMLRGWALTDEGRVTEGTADLRAGLSRWRTSGSKYQVPYRLTRAADAFRIAEDAEAGLPLTAEALEVMELSEDRWWAAEVYRVRGELLMLADRSRDAESCLERALAAARLQNARLLELRAATSLARMWRDQGKRVEGRDLLSSIYNWFTEGFDTRDLKDAKALLDELP